MSSFNNAQVTLKGSVLLAKALNGEKLVFTRVAMGDGEYSGEIGAAEDLVNIRKNLAITKLTRKENIAIIGAVLKLGDVDEEFSWTELGVYAKGEDDVEVLYMYGNAEDKASYISKLGLDEKLIDINIVVGNASNVTAMIDSSLVFLSEAALIEHEEDENAHPKLKVWVQNQFANGDWAKYSQVGESTDAETEPTVFGSLNSIKALINSFKTAFDTFRQTYTDIRGAKLDNLDAKISSRAPADTALSKNTWTDTRAGLIDAINTNTKINDTASKTGTLSQKLSYITDTSLGATTDIGGTSTAGTAMAKLNAILTWFTGTWTAARAAKIDEIGTTGDIIGKRYTYEEFKVLSAEALTLKTFTGSGFFKMYVPQPQSASDFVEMTVDGTKYACPVGEITDNSRIPFTVEVPFYSGFTIAAKGGYSSEPIYIIIQTYTNN